MSEPEIEQAWLNEAERRVAEIDQGLAAPSPPKKLAAKRGHYRGEILLSSRC